MAPTKKGSKRRGCSAINEVMTWEYTTHIHNIWKSAMMKEMGTPDRRTDTRLKAAWARGTRNVPYHIQVQSSRKHEDEDSPNKLDTLVTHVPVTLFKNLVNVDKNCKTTTKKPDLLVQLMVPFYLTLYISNYALSSCVPALSAQK
ncbi:large ribosomal subunit protein eL31-like [Marmota flaviventris]|uniref:large ribosomal subunit protein eL31-like n=1 Tax=Marmota flaviventris TaxID=93162 RepID=UPI00148EAF90|nr:60S ribosomal protein L31-like [Marmota flaviventris]